MLIKFFRNGKGAGAGPVGYLVADKVLAYDDNRDLIRDADGLRGLSKGIERVRNTLDDQDAEPDGW
ncbi:MAG: hypothetical protein ABJ360_22165 [Roseobacter sp.]